MLDNYGALRKFQINLQAYLPSAYFTCNGSFLSFSLYAERVVDDPSFELQLWRWSGDYVKVGSILIDVTDGLHEYRLSPPLRFEAGYFLGYERSGLRFTFEDVGSGQLVYYHALGSDKIQRTGRNHVLLGVTTGEVMSIM